MSLVAISRAPSIQSKRTTFVFYLFPIFPTRLVNPESNLSLKSKSRSEETNERNSSNEYEYLKDELAN